MMQLVNVGYGNMINAQRIIAVLLPDSAPVRRLIQDARDQNKAIDATCGKRTRSVMILDTGNLVLSPLQAETMSARLEDKTHKM